MSWKWGREALLLQGFKGEQLVAVKSIPGWAGWHSPPLLAAGVQRLLRQPQPPTITC